ncbi:MAG TPA: hypothetical protein P5232_00865 [Candidatus Moranbacteria bacterium]|nr:hypothetical protein [Candidatus Moranbacteria bacterium]
MKNNKITLVIFLSILISLAPIPLKNSLVFSEENYTEISENIEIVELMEIPVGTTTVIKKGITVSMNNASIKIEGNLIVKGTLNDLVKIKKTGNDPFHFIVMPGGNLEMSNVEVDGGGSAVYPCDEENPEMEAMRGAVDVVGGKFTGQNVNFHDNVVAVSIAGNGSSVKVNRSKFLNNFQYEVFQSGNPSLADFRYNWWGNPNGPIQNCEIYNACWPISGNVDSSSWLLEPDFRDPVIIVPGILGSWKITDGGKWKLDPIFKTYDTLYKTFKENGYEEGKDLFAFPYQWRDSNVNNAVLLKQKIQEIKTANNWPKVDIVAHSMGGLLTREYIESENYQDDVDQLVLLGTPNAGAPEDYLMWEGGKNPPSSSAIADLFFKLIFKQEAKEAGFSSIFEYLHKQPIKSVQELLPNYDYLYDIESKKMRSYANNEHYPKNIFLDKLNLIENARKMNSVIVTNITGKLSENKTIKKIKVEKPSVDENSLWAHGYPKGFDSLSGDHGLEYGAGDGTVPKESSENILSDEQIETNFAHSDLPGKTAKTVFKELTGNSVQEEVPFIGTYEILILSAFSPIDIQIISPSGKKVGKNFETGGIYDEIDGAYYTGFDTDNEFLTIPNPEDGEYKILTEGTGDGEYKIEATKISEDENNPENVAESIVSMTGTAEDGVQEEKTVEVSGNEVTSGGDQYIVGPKINIVSPKEKIYLNNQIMRILYFIEGDIFLTSKVEKKLYYDGKELKDSKINLYLESIGEHVVKITAKDEAQNLSEKEVRFQLTTDIDTFIKNLDYYQKNNLIKNYPGKMAIKKPLNEIKNDFRKIESIKKKKKLSAGEKEMLIGVVKESINSKIDLLIEYVEKNENHAISKKGQILFIELLNEIRPE